MLNDFTYKGMTNSTVNAAILKFKMAAIHNSGQLTPLQQNSSGLQTALNNISIILHGIPLFGVDKSDKNHVVANIAESSVSHESDLSVPNVRSSSNYFTKIVAL